MIKFYTFLSDFASLENVFTLVFHFLNSTLLFDLARRIFSTRFIKLHLPSHISVIVDQDHLWKVLIGQTRLISS